MACVFVFLVEGRARYGADLSVPVISLANAIHTRIIAQILEGQHRRMRNKFCSHLVQNSSPRSSATSRDGCENTWSFTCLTECTLKKEHKIAKQIRQLHLRRSARGRLISLAGRNLLLSSHGDGRRRGREGTSLSQGRKGPGCRLATSEHRGQSYSG